MVIQLMRTGRVTWIISVIQVFKFIGFVSVIKARRVILTLNEYAKASRSVRHQMSGKDGGMCVTLARTSQGRTALMHAAKYGHTACVEALVAAKAALDVQDVSYARLFACPVPLIFCFSSYYDIIVICNPSPIISALGYRVD
jgi:hypothetical protein